MKIAHYVLTLVLALGLGAFVAFAHFATALGAMNSSQVARGVGLALAIALFGLAALTSLLGLRSVRKAIFFTTMLPIAALDTYVTLRSRPFYAWPLIFGATAIAAAIAVLLFGRVYDWRHRDQV